MIVIADRMPLNYLVQLRRADLLPSLFGRVLVPLAVFEELRHPASPESVRAWVSQIPSWPQIQSLQSQPDPSLDYLDRGEREAITLAEELGADQLLLDDADARDEGARRHLPFIGTLGILRRAAQLDWIDLLSALRELQQTTFYMDARLIQSLLDEDAARKGNAEPAR